MAKDEMDALFGIAADAVAERTGTLLDALPPLPPGGDIARMGIGTAEISARTGMPGATVRDALNRLAGLVARGVGVNALGHKQYVYARTLPPELEALRGGKGRR